MLPYDSSLCIKQHKHNYTQYTNNTATKKQRHRHYETLMSSSNRYPFPALFREDINNSTLDLDLAAEEELLETAIGSIVQKYGLDVTEVIQTDSPNIKPAVRKELQEAAIEKQKSVIAHSEQLRGLFERELFYTEIQSEITVKLSQFTIHLIELESKLKEELNQAEKKTINQKICAVKPKIVKLFHRKGYFSSYQNTTRKGIELHKHIKKSALDDLDNLISQLTL